MRKRWYWVEPLFGEAKDFHRLRRFRLRGLLKVNIEGVMIAAGQNIKRLLKHRLMEFFCFCRDEFGLIWQRFSLLFQQAAMYYDMDGQQGYTYRGTMDSCTGGGHPQQENLCFLHRNLI